MGAEYVMVEYEQGEGPDFSRDAWLTVKPTLGLDFPNLPYIVDGDFSMTETVPIMKYLADKFKPELLGTTAEQRATVNMLANVIGDVKGAVTGPCYMGGDKAAVIEIVKTKLAPIVAKMGNNKFLTGDAPTWVDFFFFETMLMINSVYGVNLCADFPTIGSHIENMKNLSGLKEYLADPNCIDAGYIFNNKVAQFNATSGF